MTMSSRPIIDMITSKKVRYSDLINLLRDTDFKSSFNSGKMTYIYIDLESIVRRLYQKNSKSNSVFDAMNNLTNRDKIVLSSELISLAGHYRNFFASRLGLPTEIIYFFSNEASTWARNILPSYRYDYYENKLNNTNGEYSRINQNIRLNIEFMENVVRGIPGVYTFNTGDIPPHFAPSWLIKNHLDVDPESMHIILSTDDIYLQDVPLFASASVYQLYPKGSKSQIVTINNYLDLWVGKETEKSLYPHIFSAMQSLSKNNQQSISSINHLGRITALNKFDKLQSEGKLPMTRINSVERWIEFLLENSIISPSDTEESERNYKLTSHDYIWSNSTILDTLMKNYTLQKIDIMDYQSLRELNNDFYAVYPLDFDFLFQGVDHSRYFPSNTNNR